MGQVVLAKCVVTKEEDWVPVILDHDLEELAFQQGSWQEVQSREMKLFDRAIDKDIDRKLYRTINGKRAEYAVHQYFGRQARVTLPGEFHNWPDVGQANVRFIHDPADGLMIHDGDQGELPMILTTVKDISFKDKTIWLVGWGMTDLLRRHFVLVNQFREIKNWGLIGNMEPHEQFVYPRSMLNPIKTLSKEFMNTPWKKI